MYFTLISFQKSILHYRYKNSYTQDLKDKIVPIETI